MQHVHVHHCAYVHVHVRRLARALGRSRLPAREVTPPQLALLTRHTLQLCVRELAPATRAYNERGRGSQGWRCHCQQCQQNATHATVWAVALMSAVCECGNLVRAGHREHDLLL